MGKKKNTSLMEFTKIIIDNSEFFDNDDFLEFLLGNAKRLMRLEKKQIEKSYKKGFEKCLFFNDIPTTEYMETLKALDIPHLYYESKYNDFFNTIKVTENDSELKEVENELEPKKELDNNGLALESLILKELKELGVNTENVSVKFVKL